MPVTYKKAELKPFDQAVRFLEEYENNLPSHTEIKDLDKFVRQEFGQYVKAEEGFDLLKDIIYYRDWNNFEKFCNKLKIRTKSKGLTDFRLKKAQRTVWRNNILSPLVENKPVRVYILKGRQIGFTTLIQSIIYKSSAFHCDIAGNIVAHSKTKSSEIFNMYKLFLRTSPNGLIPTRRLSNRGEIFFSNPNEEGELGLESYIKVETIDNPHLGASSTLQLVHLSEFARYEAINNQAEEAISTLFQTVEFSPGTMIFLETTAYGEGLGKRFWYEDNGFQKVFIPWVCDENYRSRTPILESEIKLSSDSEYGDEEKVREQIIDQLQIWYADKDLEWCKNESLHRLKWRRRTIKQNCFGKLPLFFRDYPLSPEEAFTSSSVSVFDTLKLNTLKKQIEENTDTSTTYTYFKQDPGSDNKNPAGAFLEAVGGELEIFENPVPGEKYFIGVDVGAGVGGDESAIQVFKSDYTQVARYVNQIEADELAYPTYCLALIYNSAYVTPEWNSYGVATISKLTKDLGYVNVYLRTKPGTKDEKPQSIYGFYTSMKTRPILISIMASLIRNGSTNLRDKQTIQQALSFVHDIKKGRIEALPGEKDDIILAACLAVFPIKDFMENAHEENVEPPEGSLEYLARLADEHSYFNNMFGNSYGF